MQTTYDSQSLGRRVNEILILSKLVDAPMHGYQVALQIEEGSGGYFPFNHGTLYPILHRLEKEGLIAGSWSDPEEGRPRKQYAVTEAGRTYLAELIESWRTLQAKLESIMDPDRYDDGQVQAGAA